MPQDWVERRFEKFQAARAEQENKKAFHANALNSYPAKFQELRDRVEVDVRKHNSLFPEPLFFTGLDNGGFCVSTVDAKGLTDFERSVSVQVTKVATGTVIKIQHFNGIEAAQADQLEIVADNSGEVRFRHRNQPLREASDASKLVLQKLLDQWIGG